MTSHPTPPPPLPPLSLHLADRILKPLLSTAASTSPQSKSLSALTTAALSAQTSASRLGLGYPIHILVETQAGGPIVLHSFLDPEAQRTAELQSTKLHDVNGETGREEEGEEAVPAPLLSAPTSAEAAEMDESQTADAHAGEESAEVQEELTNGMEAMQLSGQSAATNGAVEDTSPMAPMLVATVVAESYSRISEARRAVRRLEGMGREFQEQWLREREEEERIEAEHGAQVEEQEGEEVRQEEGEGRTEEDG